MTVPRGRLGGLLVLGLLAWGVPALSAPPRDSRALDSEVRRLIAERTRSDPSLQGARIAVAVLDHRGNEAVWIQADEPMKPASNLKVLTSAAGVRLLGPGHSFETTVTATAPMQSGVIRGDVSVRGTGDPNISGRFFGGDPTALFRGWARALRSAGLQRIEGDLIADDTLFDDVRFQPTWDTRQSETWYSAEISALSLNDNCVDITVRPGARPGAPAAVEVTPPSSLITVDGSPSTVGGKNESRIVVHRKPGTNRITVTGRIAAGGAPWRGNITIHDPALFFATALAGMLEREGISVEGRIRKRDRTAPAPEPPAPGLPPAGETVLIRHASTLLQDLPVINKRSQNLHAEILLKALGAQVAREGSLSGGERAIRKFLREKAIPDDTLVLADGSGLSHKNRLSAALLARVLHSVTSEPYFKDFLDSLPVAGEDGTLDGRFRRSPELKGSLHAKTGYIAGVSCLSGYVLRGGRAWSFSILVNGLSSGARGAKRLQELIGERIHAAMSDG